MVPLSTNGTPAAKQRRFTCRLASKLSSPFKTTSNCLKKSTLKSESFTFAWYGVMLMRGLNFNTASRATWLNNYPDNIRKKVRASQQPALKRLNCLLTLALDCPTCDCRNKNCLLRLLTSIVSMSI